MAKLRLESLVKTFPDGFEAVRGVTIDVPDGALLVLVGPSGCGKTTILRMISGLEDPTGGAIYLDDSEITGVAPKDRDLAMVFQNYALYPHMTVYKNIAFALKLRHLPRAVIDQRVRETADTLGLTELLDRRPSSLSGGQRQRVAMGRAIVRNPRGFLMDEPLSNLDAKLRVQMRADIARIQRDLAVTTVYVTHDQTEAMTMGTQVAVLEAGLLQQVAPPHEVYSRPSNLFVARFIGSPAMNCVRARVASSESRVTVQFGDVELELEKGLLKKRPTLRQYFGRDVVLGIRPEDLEDASLAPGASAQCSLRVGAELVETLGSDTYVHFSVPIAADVRQTAETNEPFIDLGLGRDHVAPMVARVSPRSHVKEGSTVELAAYSSNFHFFDPASGVGIY